MLRHEGRRLDGEQGVWNPRQGEAARLGVVLAAPREGSSRLDRLGDTDRLLGDGAIRQGDSKGEFAGRSARTITSRSPSPTLTSVPPASVPSDDWHPDVPTAARGQLRQPRQNHLRRRTLCASTPVAPARTRHRCSRPRPRLVGSPLPRDRRPRRGCRPVLGDRRFERACESPPRRSTSRAPGRSGD